MRSVKLVISDKHKGLNSCRDPDPQRDMAELVACTSPAT